MHYDSSVKFLTSLALEYKALSYDHLFTVPCIKTLSKLAFDSPVTILVGENGSGKSTLLETIACGMKCPAIGLSDLSRDPMVADARRLTKQLRLWRSNYTKVKLFTRLWRTKAQQLRTFTTQQSQKPSSEMQSTWVLVQIFLKDPLSFLRHLWPSVNVRRTPSKTLILAPRLKDWSCTCKNQHLPNFYFANVI